MSSTKGFAICSSRIEGIGRCSSIPDGPILKSTIDKDITLRLHSYLFPRLKSEGLEELYSKIEEPLTKVLIDMEYEGIRLNTQVLEEYALELAQNIQKREALIFEKAGVKFNIASPKQVGEILFEKLKIPYKWSKTKTGQYSTNEEKLSEIEPEYLRQPDVLI